MDSEKLAQALTRIRDIKEAFVEDYKEGLVGSCDLPEHIAALNSEFFDSLDKLGFKRRTITPESMSRIAEDYGLWAAGESPNSTVGEPWLVRRSDNQSFVDTSAEERAAYFALAHEACFTINIWEFPPDDLARPCRREKIYGTGVRITVPFNCVDDDGLVGCEDPRGRCFSLTDANGLHAAILVEARAGYEYRPAWEKGSNYAGLVTVEGYTVPGLHSSGDIEIHNGKVVSVGYSNSLSIWGDDPHAEAICSPEEYDTLMRARESKDGLFSIGIKQAERNEEAYRSFPRWQPYFEWERTHPPKPLSLSEEDYLDSLMELLTDSLPAAE